MPNKVSLKKTALRKQRGKCNVTDEVLIKEMPLIDTHRLVAKRKGGTYTDLNTTVIAPVTHMVEHGTLRVRQANHAKLKELVDAREHIMRLGNKINNQLLAYKRQTDQLNEGTLSFLDEQLKMVAKPLKKVTKDIEVMIGIMLRI